MFRDYAMGELHKLKAEIIPYVRLFGADSSTVYFQNQQLQALDLLKNGFVAVFSKSLQHLVNKQSGETTT